MKKKTIAIVLAILAVVMCFTLAACGDKTDANSDDSLNDGANVSGTVDPSAGEEEPSDEIEEATDDLAYIKEKGKMIVGMTVYAPMNYYEDEAKTVLTGFDTEFALAVGEKLGVEIEFFEIADWDNKFVELKTKNIDCVWNGMTITDEALKNSSVSVPYVKNAQVVVMKADKIAEYPDIESMKDLVFVVEQGSAGKDAAEAAGFNYTEVKYQSDALLEVKSGAADACVIDITMANNMTGEGTSYAELGYSLELSTEEYGISFRKGSDVTAKVNDIIAELKADGTLQALADKYELTLA